MTMLLILMAIAKMPILVILATIDMANGNFCMGITEI